jgi:hypothetical protein
MHGKLAARPLTTMFPLSSFATPSSQVLSCAIPRSTRHGPITSSRVLCPPASSVNLAARHVDRQNYILLAHMGQSSHLTGTTKPRYYSQYDS